MFLQEEYRISFLKLIGNANEEIIWKFKFMGCVHRNMGGFLFLVGCDFNFEETLQMSGKGKLEVTLLLSIKKLKKLILTKVAKTSTKLRFLIKFAVSKKSSE